MIALKKITTKNGQTRYYREGGYLLDRSLPIAKAKAEAMLANGEAYLTDYLCTPQDFGRYVEAERAKETAEKERLEAEARKNVVDFAAAKKKRDEEKAKREAENEAIMLLNRFKTEVLPYLSDQDLKRFAEVQQSGDHEAASAELQRMLMTASINQGIAELSKHSR